MEWAHFVVGNCDRFVYVITTPCFIQNHELAQACNCGLPCGYEVIRTWEEPVTPTLPLKEADSWMRK